jgi:hypothetical protein
LGRCWNFSDKHESSNSLDTDSGRGLMDIVSRYAQTLLVAESDPANKETMIRLIMNMLAGEG